MVFIYLNITSDLYIVKYGQRAGINVIQENPVNLHSSMMPVIFKKIEIIIEVLKLKSSLINSFVNAARRSLRTVRSDAASRQIYAALVILALSAFIPSVAVGAAEPGLARLSYLRGNVQIYTDDTREWVPAAINTPLLEGDRLWAPPGARSEIQLEGGLFVRLDSRSAFDILALQENSYQFYLNTGHAYINNRTGSIDYIQMDTPLSSVGCYDRGVAMIDVAESGATDISVLKGYCYAETTNGKTEIPAGNTLRIDSSSAAELLPIGAPDAWEDWNIRRDRLFAEGRRSLRYLPDELDDYAYDFDTYGSWVYVADYGYCWRPAVAAGWAPYRIGRWAWIAGNYTWISYEPWGWAPCHYGRWAYVPRHGWCWVPPRQGSAYWAPGYVAWVSTPSYIAWVPLAPGEPYYGYGNYGPLSVNMARTNVDPSTVRNFRNLRVRNAVSVVDPKTFLSRGRPHGTVAEKTFQSRNVSFGPPRLKPTRTAKMPIIKTIPRTQAPPARVARLSVPKIRTERRLAPEKQGSAFRPGRTPEQMKVVPRREPARVFREPSARQAAQKPSTPERRETATRPAQRPSMIEPRPERSAPRTVGPSRAPSETRAPAHPEQRVPPPERLHREQAPETRGREQRRMAVPPVTAPRVEAPRPPARVETPGRPARVEPPLQHQTPRVIEERRTPQVREPAHTPEPPRPPQAVTHPQPQAPRVERHEGRPEVPHPERGREEPPGQQHR